MNRARAILIGTLPPPVTGQSVAFRLLVEGLRGRLPVEVCDISDRGGERRDKAFGTGRVLQVMRLAVRVLLLSRDAALAYLTIAQSRWGFLRDAALIWAAAVSRTPVVVHLHGGNYSGFYGGESRWMRALIRWTLGRVHRFVVLSENLRGEFAFLGPAATGRVVVVANASPVALGSPRAAPRGRLRLLYLSNLVVEKGYLDAVDAVVLLRRLLPEHEVSLTLAGSFLLAEDEFQDLATMERTLNKHVDYLGLDDVVHWVGPVGGAEKDRLLAEADAFVLPTYYVNEGQPLAVIEAMAVGLPVICTAWRALAEMVEDGANGLVVPPRSALAIADAAARLAGDAALYERLSAAAVATAGRFSVEAHVSAMERVFRDAMDRAAR